MPFPVYKETTLINTAPTTTTVQWDDGNHHYEIKQCWEFDGDVFSEAVFLTQQQIALIKEYIQYS